MIMLFDQEYAVQQTMKAQREEALAEGREEGRVEGREEGRVEGREEGRVEGRKEGRVEGREEGRVEGVLKTLFNLVRKGILTVSIAAKEAGMKEADFQTLMNQQKTEAAEQRS